MADPIVLAHGTLNALHAGLQGRFVFLNALAQLEERRPDIGGLAEDLEAVIAWFGALWERRIDEPPRLFELWDAQKEDLRDLVALLKESDDDALRAAALARQAYSREHYIKGLIAWGEKFGPEEVADRWRQHLLPSQNGIAVAHHFLGAIARGDDVAADLKEKTRMLPFVYASQLVDMAVLDGHRAGGLTWQHAGIDDPAAWEGLDPEQAAYWKAYGFNGAEARAYLAQGYDFARAAAERMDVAANV